MRFLAQLATLCLLCAAARADQVLLDFEKARDVNLWQAGDGEAVSQTDNNPLGTGKAMEVPVGAHIQTSMLPRDWSGHEYLEFQYVNETHTPVSMLVIIGDLAWLDTRSLWNQYNETFLLATGRGTLRIPVKAMPRGQGKQINLDLKGNVDPSAIVHVELEFKGSAGRLVIDDLKLAGGGDATPPAALTPTVAPPSADPAAPPAPPPAAGEKTLCDFENLRDLGLWEQRGGAALVQLSLEHATRGNSSMVITNDTLIITEAPPVNWTGFDQLEFDVFVTGGGMGSVEVMIGDGAWLGQQNYWNRYNRIFGVAPGSNTVSIAVSDLFRGEPSRRNTMIKRNLDLNAIAAVSLHFTHLGGNAYLDNLRLTRAAGSAGAPPPAAAAAPAAAPAPAPAALAGPELVINDFETAQQLGKWETRSGPAPVLVSGHATGGAKAMEVRPGTLIATYEIPRDWSGYESLELDLHNQGEGLVKVELLIGDDAWTQKQTYWNRHNAMYTLVPGDNTLSIPVSGLYRGEAGARNRDLKGNLDPKSIVFLSLNFYGKPEDPAVVMDRMRLVRSAAFVPAAGSVPGGNVPVTGTPAGGAVPVTGTPGGDLVWCGFEALSDFAKWEVRSGPAPALVAQKATQGAKSLECHPGNLLATYDVPRDWRGYEALEFDVHNASDQIVKLELLIGDDAWSGKQTYWNRHNAMYTLAPGDNTISVPVSGLYRGEAAARNRDILRNLDVDAINFLSLTFHGAGGGGALYLDNLRLKAPAGGVVAPAPGTAPGAALPAEAPPAAAGDGATRVWCGFEKPADFAQWEVRGGPEPKIVSTHASEGAKALEIHPGNLLATYAAPRDWSRHRAMEFDLFNPGGELVKIEIVVGDDDWTQKQNYWNRHNAVYTLAPGANTLSIPVDGLYRGEAGARNRDILRNIEPAQINFFSITVHEGAGRGPLYLDNLRLKGVDAPAPALAAGVAPLQVRGFDFGPADQQLWPGFQAVSWNTVYDPAKGYGLERAQARESYSGDTTFPSRLLADYVWIEKGEFLADLPNGDYQVAVFFEESGYWAGEHTRHTKRGIYAEGVEKVLEDRTARGPDDDALHLLQDTEPVPGQDVLRSFFEKLYAPRVFTTTVSDGQLNLGFVEDARLSVRVSAVVILPAGHPGAAAWIADLLEKNLKELRTKAAGFPLRPPKYDGLPEAALRQPALMFIPGLAQTVSLTDVPAADRLGGVLTARIARGETGSMTFALHPLQELGECAVKVEMDAGGGPDVRVRSVRHLAKRGFGDSSFRVLPWWLADCGSIALPKGITRQFWVNATAAAAGAAGKHAGVIVVTPAAGAPIRVPFEIEVLPFALEKPDFSFTFFGMPAESVGVFAEYGVTALNGGPQIRFKGFQPNGDAAFDFARSDAFFADAKKSGIDRMALDYSGPAGIEGVGWSNIESFFQGEGAKLGISADEAAKRVFDAIEAHAREQGWPPLTFHLVDEPLSAEISARSARAVEFVKKAAPWIKTCGYYSFRPQGDPLGNDKLFRLLDVTITKGYDGDTLRAAKEAGHGIALYSLAKNRFVFGPLMYRHARNGVLGYVQWHSSIIHGYQFLDLDGREPDDGVIMLTREGVRPTLDLERCRMGIQDFRYLQTLASRAKAAGEKGAPALAKLDELLQRIPMDTRDAPAGLDLDAFRREVADLILSL